MENRNIFEFEHAKFWTSAGILYCEFKNTDANYVLTAQEAGLFIEAINSLSQGQPMPFLVIVGNSLGSFTTEAALLIANSPILKKIRICEAFLASTINGKLLINSYKRIYEPITPFHFFNNIKDAMLFCVESKNDFYANPKTRKRKT